MKDWLPVVISVVVALAGTGGIVFGALRYNRDEAGKVVSQQSTILDDMRDLMAEQQSALTNARVERDEERSASQRCRDELKRLKRVMVDMLSGRVGDPEQEDEPRDDD